MFPRLHTLTLGHLDGLYTATFLGRHPNIAILSIFTMKDENPTGDLSSLCFPNLRFYLGRTALFPSWLSRSSSLEALILIYDCAHPMTNKTFEFLSHTPAERLHLLLSEWNVEGCRVVSKMLPALKAIKFINISRSTEDHAMKASQVRRHRYPLRKRIIFKHDYLSFSLSNISADFFLFLATWWRSASSNILLLL